ncbi:MAG: 2-amino-4-hydroxy-6-hydroxymethyldihydropteridine diphosphokinase [Candidatus Omnitrophota bacterium]
MSTAYIGVGSNLGDRQKNIDLALDKIRSRKGVEVEKVSAIIETEPVGNIDQPKFLNAAFRIATTLYPDELLDALKSIERELGRDKDSVKKRLTVDEQLKMLQDGNLEMNPVYLKNEENERPKRWGPRAIDLDILFYDDVMMKGNNLVIPHPLLHERLFVLEPLSEIAPDLMHPVLKRSIKDLILDLRSSADNDSDQKPQQDAGGSEQA